MKRIALFACTAVLAVAALGTPVLAASDAPSRYTFSWPLGQDAPAPRGGTTKGQELRIDRAPSAAWQALQAPGLAPLERDRRAILAMAGSYRVAFDFLEVVTFAPSDPAKRDRPYQSWGTEKIFVDRDEGKYISLVHILEMRIMQDGKLSDPIVTKHWRQDWRYEPRDIVEYTGDNQWKRRELRDTKGQWSQTVVQVDESPRYASVGKWEHSAAMSSWISADTWRPLPRREWSVRKDYQVLVGTNRHTIMPWGWVQEENNLKTVLSGRKIDASKAYLGREYGVAKYERIADPDFAAADVYYQRTREFWNRVVDAWYALFRERGTITLNAAVDQAGLFEKLFAHADTLAEGGKPTDDERTLIQQAFKDMGAIEK